MNNKGVSLIEMVIAVALIAVIVSPFLLAFNQSLNANIRTEKISIATQIAANTMENVKLNAKTSVELTQAEAIAKASSTFGIDVANIDIQITYSDTLSNGVTLENNYKNVVIVVKIINGSDTSTAVNESLVKFE